MMIPCLFMRGGTSRGAYFLQDHLPHDRETLNRVLLAVMGSPHACQVDGIGGATPTTSKVAILSISKEPAVDVDYKLAVVSVTDAVVDWEPSCGNILAGVPPAAIEMGLIPRIGNSETRIKIRLLNNGSFVEAVVQTPGGQVTYDGQTAIDGVPGTSAPIELHFTDIVGSKCNKKLLPTGRVRDVIDGIEVTCLDCAVPIVIAAASAMGKTAYESKADLDGDAPFLRRVEAIRHAAGEMMGLGDVTGRIIPKIAIVAAPRGHGNVTARYFLPDAVHPSLAVTGAISISCCSLLEGSVAYDVSTNCKQVAKQTELHNVIIEHPSGEIPIILKAKKLAHGSIDVQSAGVIRTARLLFTGLVTVPNKSGLERLHEPEEYRKMHKQFCQLFAPKSPAPSLEMQV